MYIGEKQIKSETDLNNGYVEVTFEDEKDVISNDVLNVVKTEEPSTDSDVRDLKCEIIVKDILEILLKYNAKTSELNFILSLVLQSINENEKNAISKLLGQDDQNVTLLRLDEILKD